MPEENVLFWAEISEELWNDVPQNEEDLSYMLDDETTPVKACGDLAYNVSNAGKTVLWLAPFLTLSWQYLQLDQLSFFLCCCYYYLSFSNSNNGWFLDPKEPEECRETYSQAKRRRMLQFNSQDSDQSLSNEEMSLSYLKNVSGCSTFFGLTFHIRNGSNGFKKYRFVLVVQNLPSFWTFPQHNYILILIFYSWLKKEYRIHIIFNALT